MAEVRLLSHGILVFLGAVDGLDDGQQLRGEGHVHASGAGQLDQEPRHIESKRVVTRAGQQTQHTEAHLDLSLFLMF